MDLIYFTLIAYGLTLILTKGNIFNKIRPNKKFFKCSMCIGFWVGIFLFAINGYTELFTFKYNLINPILLGSLSSGTSYFLNMLIGDKGIRHDKKMDDTSSGSL
jgi:hypothetical protein